MYRLAKYLFLFALTPMLVGCPTASPGGVSDIPCLSPTAWRGELDGFTVKEVDGDSSGLLLKVDLRDNDSDPVYFFNQQNETFMLVNNDVWDNNVNQSQSCILNQNRESPFVVTGLFERNLRFQGEIVPVVGGNLVRRILPNSVGSIVAISTDGQNLSVFGTSTNGQLYYQVFSEIDGSALNIAQRISSDGISVTGCTSVNDKFLVLDEKLTALNEDTKICVGELP